MSSAERLSTLIQRLAEAHGWEARKLYWDESMRSAPRRMYIRSGVVIFAVIVPDDPHITRKGIDAVSATGAAVHHIRTIEDGERIFA